jgi:hypothetical protein
MNLRVSFEPIVMQTKVIVVVNIHILSILSYTKEERSEVLIGNCSKICKSKGGNNS